MGITIHEVQVDSGPRHAVVTVPTVLGPVQFCILTNCLAAAMADGGPEAGIQLIREETASVLRSSMRTYVSRFIEEGAGDPASMAGVVHGRRVFSPGTPQESPSAEDGPSPVAGLAERQRRSGEIIAERRRDWPPGGWPASTLRKVRGCDS